MITNREDSPFLRWILVLLPFISFFGQYFFSVRAGTLPLMLRHPTVTYVDWIFIPFNYFVVRTIDWKKGTTMFVIWCLSLCLVVATHVLWQVQGTDPGHMITKAGVFLPAGWIHLVFSTFEMVLLVAFVFCRRPDNHSDKAALSIALMYFVAMAVSGYSIHHRVIASDACVLASGLFFLLIYPKLKSRITSP